MWESVSNDLVAASFKMLLVPIALFWICQFFGIHENPFKPMLFISYPLPQSPPEDPRYAKGWLDLLFIAYYVIVFSFVRQFTILGVLRPLASYLGIKKERKIERFGEQGYAILYWGSMGLWGLVRSHRQ
jgi:very-long-chain ceramide synthase